MVIVVSAMMNNLIFIALLFATDGTAAFRSSFAPSLTSQRGVLSHRSRITTSTFDLNPRISATATQTASAIGPLMLSSSAEDILQGRKKRVTMGYKAMTALYIAVFLYSISKSIALKTLLTISSYLVMPAGLSYIMVSAAKHDRLGSDTYKRINLSLLKYSILGISVIKLSGGGNPILKVAYLITLINTIKGYAYGVLGLDKKSGSDTLLQDFLKGIQSTFKGICSVPKNLKSVGYLAATLFVMAMKLLKLKEIIFAVQSSVASKEIAMSLARFNRLSLLALMIYTLKDAADRDRLSGTTFIQLNYLCAFVLAIVGGVGGGTMTSLGGVSAAMAAFLALNGLSSYLGKKKSS